MARATLLLFLLLIVFGCSKPPLTEQAYANAFKAAGDKYFAVTKEVADAELPDNSGLSRPERTRILVAHIRTQNDKFKSLVSEFQLLIAPKKYQGLHDTYLQLLEGQVRRDNKYVAAIEADDGILVNQLSKEYNEFLESSFLKVLDEIEKAGGDAGKMRESFKSMMKSIQPL